ncbi:MAG: phage major capsid protein [Bacteroidales bacterium]|nr:phage major capsid protein [Bacteroidales bacterium]
MSTFAQLINEAGDHPKQKMEIRSALVTGTGTKSLDIISPLLANLVLKQAGATILTGLDVTKTNRIPVASGNPAHWVGEEGEAVSFNSPELTPYSMVAQFIISNLLLQQTNDSVEKYLIDLAAKSMAVEIEKAVLGDEDTEIKPKGVFNGASKWGETNTYEQILALIHSVETKNVRPGSFITNGDTAKTLRAAQKNGYGQILDNGTIYGFPCLVTESAVGLAFGGWSDLVIGLYDKIYVVSDPYTAAEKGETIITIYFDASAKLIRETSIARVK